MSGLARGAPRIGEAVEEAAVRGGAARHRLDVAQVGVAEAEADRAARPAAVGGFEDEEPPGGAHEGRTGDQEFMEGAVQGAGPGQPFGEFVQGGEIGDPAGQPVLDEGSRRGGNAFRGCGSVR